MSVTGIGYVVHNKARVALERALRNPRKRVLGVEWESILTFGFSTQEMGVGSMKFVPWIIRINPPRCASGRQWVGQEHPDAARIVPARETF